MTRQDQQCERCGDEREVYEVVALTPNGDQYGTMACPDCMGEACHRCGSRNPSWSASSPLWNAVMRGGSIDGDPIWDDMVCATCFMKLTEQQGIASGFRVTADQVNVELETVTPSGRIWDEERQLWVGGGA